MIERYRWQEKSNFFNAIEGKAIIEIRTVNKRSQITYDKFGRSELYYIVSGKNEIQNKNFSQTIFSSGP